jgi:hypothetical protein
MKFSTASILMAALASTADAKLRGLAAFDCTDLVDGHAECAADDQSYYTCVAGNTFEQPVPLTTKCCEDVFNPGTIYIELASNRCNDPCKADGAILGQQTCSETNPDVYLACQHSAGDTPYEAAVKKVTPGTKCCPHPAFDNFIMLVTAGADCP